MQVTGKEDLEYADILSLTVSSLKDLFSLIVIRKKLLYQCYFSGFLGTLGITTLFTMPNNARCAVDYCDNDKRYPDYTVKRSHVEELTFHKWPTDKKLAEIWQKQVAKSRSDSFNPAPGAKGTYVCSNHFQGK